jgi:hypothetical protein
MCLFNYYMKLDQQLVLRTAESDMVRRLCIMKSGRVGGNQ